MVAVVRIVRTGGPEVMTLEVTDEQSPGRAEVWVEQEAIGVNFLDVLQRNGAAPIPLPSGLGYEGAGQVTAIGAGVQNVRVGDRVAYAVGPIGAYASGRLYPADRARASP
jgi:NADPH2:quinone reductase